MKGAVNKYCLMLGIVEQQGLQSLQYDYVRVSPSWKIAKKLPLNPALPSPEWDIS